ncbi:hypothetical protein LOZ53_001689 [Ophidiomyces ophidiicola]|nr:hypothetical protein LOZ51_004831 [Ophidiomyces ophidiicola]KAI1991413.1 hypothetical protein LOZ54_002167 [Ophidiomyces ophidiicola]KAI1994922.1 hypothetical protein LOZ53_001689 [Ophidiomyces ophidiicola]
MATSKKDMRRIDLVIPWADQTPKKKEDMASTYSNDHIAHGGYVYAKQFYSFFIPPPSPANKGFRVDTLEQIANYFVDFPLSSSAFGELGRRTQILEKWIRLSSISRDTVLSTSIEKFALSLFPFLRLPHDSRPLSSLLKRPEKGSKGIVIPVSTSYFRFGCHLVGSIRNVLKSQIPIEIAYAGDLDLPPKYRQFLSSLDSGIYFVDVTTYFDNDFIGFSTGAWAIKPFAVLASRFEQVMLMDSDSVLLQRPEVVFEKHNGFKETGALLFHDRLLFQNAFPERHAWWEAQMKYSLPSKNFRLSRVHNEKYAEEGESGMVVVNKSRLAVVMGLLHAAWQNTKEVRDRVTYRMGYGDKESWWFAFELCNTPYIFEPHYAAILGEIRDTDNIARVCSFNIAHTDENGSLLWFNGSLLKNKALNTTEFWVPKVWMLNGEWEKGQSKSMWSCMKNGTIMSIQKQTSWILQKSVQEAERLDLAIAMI